MEKPVAPPRRKYRSVSLMPGDSMPIISSSPTPQARPLMEKQYAAADSISLSSSANSEVTMEGTTATRYTDFGSSGRPKPARPMHPPRYRGDFAEHHQVPAPKSSPLSRKVQQQPKGVARVAVASSSSAPSSPNTVGARKQVHDSVSLSQFYGKNSSYASTPSPSTRRTRQSVSGVPEESDVKEPTSSTTTIINSRIEQGRGVYLNVAPKPPPAKFENGLERLRRHSDEPVPKPARLEKKEVGRNTLPRSSDSSGWLNGARSHVVTGNSQKILLQKNSSIQPLDPSSKGGKRRLVPVRPAPPAPVHRKASLRRFSNSVKCHEADYEYVNPAKARYSPAVQNTEVRLSQELEGLDLTIYSVVDDSPPDTTDVKESTSKNIYAALNTHELLDSVYAVPECSSTINSPSSASNQVTEQSSCSNSNKRNVRGSVYANVQYVDKRFQKSKSFVLDTSGGQGSPSPTSKAPLIEEEEEGDSVFSPVESIYMPVSKDTLDHTPVYQAVNCSRKTISLS